MLLSDKKNVVGTVLSLWGLLILVLATTTLFIADKPYSSHWFFTLLGLAVGGLALVIAVSGMWRRRASFVLHISILLILAGGALTAIWGERGTLVLYADRLPVRTWLTDNYGLPRRLPEAIALDSIVANVYKQGAPTDYRCFVNLSSGRKILVRVNHPLNMGAYSFCLASCHESGFVRLQVNHDPARGDIVSFAGSILFLAGLTLVMTNPSGRFRRLLKALPRKKKVPRFLPVLLTIVLGWQIFIFVKEWVTVGSIPLADGHGAMSFLSLILTAISIWLVICRQWLLSLLILIMSGFATLVAWMANPLGSDIPPILSSPWLAVHVGLIMAAYAFLTLTFAVSLASAIHPTERLRTLSLAILYPAIFLLFAGIFSGAIWASQAWGRYWAWDPKETWSLITLMVYCIPLHISMRPHKLALFFISAFITVIITYWGVNYLPSLHSYS